MSIPNRFSHFNPKILEIPHSHSANRLKKEEKLDILPEKSLYYFQKLPKLTNHKDHHISNSLDNLQAIIDKSKTTKKMPPLLPTLHESLTSNIKETPEIVKLTKFIIKKEKKPIFEQKGPLITISDERNVTPKHTASMKKRYIPFNPNNTNNMSKCPFGDFNKNSMSYLSKNEISPEKKDIAVENLMDLFTRPAFSYVVLDFEQKVLKVPQLAKFFETVDARKIFQGKMEFFKKTQGKVKNANILSLEIIHRKIGITNDDFNVFKGFFAIVMREHEIEEEIIADFLNFLEFFRKNIVFQQTILQKAMVDIDDFENSLIEKFIYKISVNHIVNPFFIKKDIAFQKNHAKSVLMYLVKRDDKNENAEESLRVCHKDQAITDHIFYHFKQCFLNSLKEYPEKLKDTQECPIGFHEKNKETSYFNENHRFDIGDKLENARLAVLNQETYYQILMKQYNFDKIIDFFLQRSLKKPTLKTLFFKFPKEIVRKHAKLMLEFILGGPTKYSKCDITPAHYKMDLSLTHYEEFRNALDETLTEFKIFENDRNYILSELDYFKYDLCNEKPLLKRIGGSKSIEFIINSFYLKAFQHPNLKEFFSNSDIVGMINNQRFFFCKFFDNCGMKAYHFKDLRTFHLGMGITDEAFKFFIDILLDCLRELDFHEPVVMKEAEEWLKRTRNDVLDLKNE